ncbi:MAG: cache domain-containing protein [Afipia felis]|nr:cache domain-containing protein [Afipia felis]
MFRKFMIVTALTSIVCMSAEAASQYGTPTEAKAMLKKAVAAVKADKDKALAMFNNGEGGFRDRDLQPFCFQLSDGKVVASTTGRLGQDIRNNVDKNGNYFGKELYAKAVEGKIGEVSYFFPRPGTNNPVPKTSYVTAANGLGCAVGFYK